METKSVVEKKSLSSIRDEIRGYDKLTRIDLSKDINISTPDSKLSPFNKLFVSAQLDGVMEAVVGQFNQWRNHGRTVRLGEKAAAYVFAPSGKQDADGKEILNVLPMFLESQTVPYVREEKVEVVAAK